MNYFMFLELDQFPYHLFGFLIKIDDPARIKSNTNEPLVYVQCPLSSNHSLACFPKILCPDAVDRSI